MATRILAGLGQRWRERARARPRGEAGFTLLEVLVVLVILGLIAAVIAGPQVFKILGTAKSETAKMQIERIGGALDLYRLEIGRYPSDQEGIAALVEPPAGVPRWNGPYLKKKESLSIPGDMFTSTGCRASTANTISTPLARTTPRAARASPRT